MKHASYRTGVAWLANNDEPGDDSITTTSELISVLLLADLFGKEPHAVAIDVCRRRQKDGLIVTVKD